MVAGRKAGTVPTIPKALCLPWLLGLPKVMMIRVTGYGDRGRAFCRLQGPRTAKGPQRRGADWMALSPVLHAGSPQAARHARLQQQLMHAQARWPPFRQSCSQGS